MTTILDPEGDILFLKSSLFENSTLPSMQLHNEEMILVEKLMISRDHAWDLLYYLEYAFLDD